MREILLPLLLLSASAPIAGAAGPDAKFAAGAAAARQAVLAQNAAVAWSWQERHVLIERLADPDPAVRKQALRTLRGYIHQTHGAVAAVLAVLGNPNEEFEVRYQAAKTLSFVTRYPEVRTALARYASDPQIPPAFRGIANKALYRQAAGNPEVRAFLTRALQDPSKEGMQGAVWALAQASHYPDTAALLMGIASTHPDMEIRAQAARSLYRGAGIPEVHAAMLATATNVRTDPRLRLPAILALSKVKTPASQAALNALARGEANPELRRAAVAALDPFDQSVRDYFYVPRFDFDPLDGE